jgi:peptidyl-prolyl cis-trans isomerase SurA
MSLFRILLAVALLAPVFAMGQDDPPNGIRAVVHDAVITADEVEIGIIEAAKRWSLQYHNRPDLFQGKLNELRGAKLEELVDRQLILHEFKTAGYSLPESVIDELVQEEIHSKFRDRVTATKSLQEQGLTYEKFRQQLRDQFIVVALRQKNVSSEIIISPHKIETYYAAHKDDYKVEDEVKLRMIEIQKKKDSDAPDARKMCEEILQKIKGGASFEEMAKGQYNLRSQRGVQSYHTSQLRKELADAAAKLKAKEVSEVIDTPEACYLIFLEESHPTHVKPLPEVREDIEKDLKSQERARLEKQWIERLKKKTFFRYF